MSIRIDQINKKFGDFVAVDNVSLSIQTGELTALLGPSGSGKTSLLRIIAGLEQADSGSIHFDDLDISARHVSERGVGFVFQHYALFKHMTVYENVAFGLTVKPKKHRPSPELIRKKCSIYWSLCNWTGQPIAIHHSSLVVSVSVLP